MNDFKIYMIRIKGHEVSEKYANYCVKSWTDAGFDVEFYDAVTPQTLHLQEGVIFGRKGNPMRYLTDTEKACYYSQWNLWKQCAEEGVPYLILEHDAWLEKPSWINFIDHFNVQYLGEHAMEAVMFHPKFCEILMQRTKKQSTCGPMNFVHQALGLIGMGHQFSLPHAFCAGPHAPVRSVIDLELGTTVEHPNYGGKVTSTLDQLANGENHHKFKIVRL